MIHSAELTQHRTMVLDHIIEERGGEVVAALRAVVADHILTTPQRFLESTHKQDLILFVCLFLLIVGGPRSEKKEITTSSSNATFFFTPCSKRVLLLVTLSANTWFLTYF